MNVRILALAVVALTCLGQSAHAVLLAYEGFDYSTAELSGQSGGFGFSGPWERIQNGLEETAIFDVSQDGVSLDSPTYPVAAMGGRLSVSGPGGTGGNNTRVVRPLANPFNLAQDGVLYASFLFQKDVSVPGSNNNWEFGFNPGQVVRVGSTSNDQWFLNVAANAFGSVSLNVPYFIVVRVDAFELTDDVRSVMIFDTSQTVPQSEPITWDFSNTVASSAAIEAVQLWIGRLASGQIDEIRVGTTWESVTIDEVEFPDPALPGDFNDDEIVDGADLAIWSANFGQPTGATTSTGDANGDGAVDGADFLVWQRGLTAPPAASAAVPEPHGGILAASALLAAHWGKRLRRGRAR